MFETKYELELLIQNAKDLCLDKIKSQKLLRIVFRLFLTLKTRKIWFRQGKMKNGYGDSTKTYRPISILNFNAV